MLRSSNKAGCLYRIERADKFRSRKKAGHHGSSPFADAAQKKRTLTPVNAIRAREVQWDWLHLQ